MIVTPCYSLAIRNGQHPNAGRNIQQASLNHTDTKPYRIQTGSDILITKHVFFGIQIPNVFYLCFSLVQRKEGNVVIHGDIWANNYLFSNTDDNSCLMVDWQFTTTGTMTSYKLIDIKTPYLQLLGAIH